ncbi:unnamed protein product [Amoebophrya sp. A120]|nr:unnamed protein product [Amoebophrya sp. A120]|eukprot:GSA120T00019255001.1
MAGSIDLVFAPPDHIGGASKRSGNHELSIDDRRAKDAKLYQQLKDIESSVKDLIPGMSFSGEADDLFSADLRRDMKESAGLHQKELQKDETTGAAAKKFYAVDHLDDFESQFGSSRLQEGGSSSSTARHVVPSSLSSSSKKDKNFLFFDDAYGGPHASPDQDSAKMYDLVEEPSPVAVLESEGVNVRARGLMGRQTIESRARLLMIRRQTLLAHISYLDRNLEATMTALLRTNPAYNNDPKELADRGISFCIEYDKLSEQQRADLAEQAPQIEEVCKSLRAFWEQTCRLCELMQWKWRMLQQIMQLEADIEKANQTAQSARHLRGIARPRTREEEETRHRYKVLMDKFDDFSTIIRLVQMNRIAEPDVTVLGDRDQEKTLNQMRLLESRLDIMTMLQDAGQELRSVDMETNRLIGLRHVMDEETNDLDAMRGPMISPEDRKYKVLSNIGVRAKIEPVEEMYDVRAREMTLKLKHLEERRKALLEEIDELNRQYTLLHAQRTEVERELGDTQALRSKSLHHSLGLGAAHNVNEVAEKIMMGPDLQLPGKESQLESIAVDLQGQREEMAKLIAARHTELRQVVDKKTAVEDMLRTHRRQEMPELDLESLLPKSALEKDGLDRYLHRKIGADIPRDLLEQEVLNNIDPMGSYFKAHHMRDAIRSARIRSSVLQDIARWDGETVRAARSKIPTQGEKVHNADLYFSLIEKAGGVENAPKWMREWQREVQEKTDFAIDPGRAREYVLFYPDEDKNGENKAKEMSHDLQKQDGEQEILENIETTKNDSPSPSNKIRDNLLGSDAAAAELLDLTPTIRSSSTDFKTSKLQKPTTPTLNLTRPSIVPVKTSNQKPEEVDMLSPIVAGLAAIRNSVKDEMDFQPASRTATPVLVEVEGSSRNELEVLMRKRQDASPGIDWIKKEHRAVLESTNSTRSTPTITAKSKTLKKDKVSKQDGKKDSNLKDLGQIMNSPTPFLDSQISASAGDGQSAFDKMDAIIGEFRSAAKKKKETVRAEGEVGVNLTTTPTRGRPTSAIDELLSKTEKVLAAAAQLPHGADKNSTTPPINIKASPVEKRRSKSILSTSSSKKSNRPDSALDDDASRGMKKRVRFYTDQGSISPTKSPNAKKDRGSNKTSGKNKGTSSSSVTKKTKRIIAETVSSLLLKQQEAEKKSNMSTRNNKQSNTSASSFSPLKKRQAVLTADATTLSREVKNLKEAPAQEPPPDDPSFLYYREKYSDVPLATQVELSRENARRKWIDKIKDLEEQIEEKNKVLLKTIQRPNLVTRYGGIPLDDDPQSGMTINGQIRSTEMNRALASNIREVMDDNLREFLHDELHQKKMRELGEIVSGLKRLETEETVSKMRNIMNELCEIRKQPDFGNYYKNTSQSFGYELPNERQMQAMHSRFVSEYMRKDGLGNMEVQREASTNLKHMNDPALMANQISGSPLANFNQNQMNPVGSMLPQDLQLGGSGRDLYGMGGGMGGAVPGLGGNLVGMDPDRYRAPHSVGMDLGVAPTAAAGRNGVLYYGPQGGVGQPGGNPVFSPGPMDYRDQMGSGIVQQNIVPLAEGVPVNTGVAHNVGHIEGKLEKYKNARGPQQQKMYQPGPYMGRLPVPQDLATAISSLRQSCFDITEGMPFIATGAMDFARPWLTDQLHFAAGHDAHQLDNPVEQIMLQMRYDESCLERSTMQDVLEDMGPTTADPNRVRFGPNSTAKKDLNKRIMASLQALRDVLFGTCMSAMAADDYKVSQHNAPAIQQELESVLQDYGLFSDLREAIHEKYLGHGAWDMLQVYLQNQSPSASVKRQDIGKLLQAMGIDLHFRNLCVTAVHCVAHHLYRTCVSVEAERDASQRQGPIDKDMPMMAYGIVNNFILDNFPIWNRATDPEYQAALQIPGTTAPNLTIDLPVWTSDALERAARTLAYDVKKRVLFLSKKVQDLKNMMKGGRGRMLFEDRQEFIELKYWQPKLVEIQAYTRIVGDMRNMELKVDKYTPSMATITKGEERLDASRAHFDLLLRLQFSRQCIGMKIAMYGNQLWSFLQQTPQEMDWHSSANHFVMENR